MARTLTLIAACALSLFIVASARAQDSTAASPSLGDLARQAQKDKDKTKKPTAKVLTNDDLPSGSGGASSSLGAGLGQTSQMTPGGKAGAEPSPAEKLAMLETVVDRVEGLDRATLVRNVLSSNDIDFPGRAKWEERLFAAKETYVTRARDLIQKARQIVSAADSLKGNQDPSDPRVKEMGARLEALTREAVQTDSAFQAIMIEGRDLAAQAAAH